MSGVVRTPSLASAHPEWQHVTRANLLSNREGLSPFVRSREESWWVRAHGQRREMVVEEDEGASDIYCGAHAGHQQLCGLLCILSFGKLSPLPPPPNACVSGEAVNHGAPPVPHQQ